jgi:RIP metalloprotease RseP
MDIALYLLGILFVILGIALSIGLHELGHYAPAKLFGVRVRQFMIGFGPTFFSRKRGETEFGLKAFPLGGYILMAGMYPTEAKEYRGPFAGWIKDARQELANQMEPGDVGRQFYALKPWKKSVIMLGGPLMNFFLGVLLIAIALSGIGTLQNSLTVREVYQCVDTLADGSCPAEAPVGPAQVAGMQAGDRVIEVNSQPVTSWDEATSSEHDRG